VGWSVVGHFDGDLDGRAVGVEDGVRLGESDVGHDVGVVDGVREGVRLGESVVGN